MKIRVFELAKAKNLPISRTLELLSQKGIQDATAVTYVEQAILDDVPNGEAQTQPLPDAPDRSATLARNILNRSETKSGWDKEEPRSSMESPLAIIAVGVGAASLLFAVFLFFSERSDRADIARMQAEINLVKAGNAKIEDVVVSNRAQILETREQMVAVEKRFYEFKKSSLTSQLKSQGVVLKALSENMREPLKSKFQALSNGLSTF
ncbi:MAG: hypothetical protein HY280_07625 [Nitrospinae bacterium]|nr:hypothetical protein [Nitrospinota bacterium]